MSDVAAVEQANARFYQAFETLDLARMELVWSHGEHVKCVHPGWPILVGWDAVRSSWATIFENTAEMRFTLSDVRASAGGDLAWVTCTENIFSEVHGRLGRHLDPRHQSVRARAPTAGVWSTITPRTSSPRPPRSTPRTTRPGLGGPTVPSAAADTLEQDRSRRARSTSR